MHVYMHVYMYMYIYIYIYICIHTLYRTILYYAILYYAMPCHTVYYITSYRGHPSGQSRSGPIGHPASWPERAGASGGR